MKLSLAHRQLGYTLPPMQNFFLHPATTCVFGVLGGAILLVLLLASCSGTNDTAAFVQSYRENMNKAGSDGPAAGSAAEKEAQERFGDFLRNVGTKSAIKEKTALTYAEGAYLNDTLVTHYGPEEIKKYFLKTAETMTEFEVTIDDVARSGDDHYFRWTMIFAAPKLGKGDPIHSVGMSQVRFDSEGKVVFHQDFWDSGKNIFGQAPLSGGIIDVIRKRIAKE